MRRQTRDIKAAVTGEVTRRMPVSTGSAEHDFGLCHVERKLAKLVDGNP